MKTRAWRKVVGYGLALLLPVCGGVAQPVANSTEQAALALTALHDSTPNARLLATLRLTDQTALAQLAQNDAARSVRRAAASRLTDQAVLAKVAAQDSDKQVQTAALAGLNDQKLLTSVLFVLTADGYDYEQAIKAACKRITDQTLLAKLALESRWSGEFIARVTDQAVLAKLVQRGEVAAIEKLTDQALLARIVREDQEWRVKVAAVERLTDQTLLAQIAQSDSMDLVRSHAGRQLKKLQGEQKAQSEIEQVTDQAALAKIVQIDDDGDLVQAAMQKLTDPVLLARVALGIMDADTRQKHLSGATYKSYSRPFSHRFPEEAAAEVRAMAVEKVTDQGVLAKIALEDASRNVRGAAISRLTDQTVLLQILGETSKAAWDSGLVELKKKVLERLEPANLALKAHVSWGTLEPEVRIAALKYLADQTLLERFATTDENATVRAVAAQYLTNSSALATIALNDKDADARRMAVKNLNLTDQVALAKAASEDKNADVRQVAAGNMNLTDETTLEKVAQSDENERVRGYATENLTDPALLAKLVLQDGSGFVRFHEKACRE